MAAHAELAASAPAANSSLVDSPAELRLTFTEPIDSATAVVELLDAGQRTVDGLGATSVDVAGRVVTAPLPTLAAGVYTVSYQVVSTVDGHATAGLLSFVVDPTGLEPPPALGPSSTSPSVDGASVAARWLALAGALVALGSLVMWWNAGIDVLARDAPTADRRPPWLLIGAASCLAFVGLALYLALAARPIISAIGGGHGGHGGAGFPLDFAAPFGWTPFAVAVRVALASSLGGFVLCLGRYFSLQGRVVAAGQDRRLAAVIGVLLAIALAGMSMAGHAAASGGPGFGAIDWLHLASVAAWLGALPAAVILARRAPHGGETMRSLLRRHGRVALVAAPITALTGLANTPLVLGAPRDLVASDYGNLLLAKATLIAIALGMGAVNHLALRGRRPVNIGLLIGVDLVVALLAVLVAATMVTIQPAAGRQPVAASVPAGPAHLYGTAGPSSVHASVSLPAPGQQDYRVTVTDLVDGAPRADLQKVFITFVPPSADLASTRVELAPGAVAGIYAATGAYTPIEGTWQLEVTVRRSGALDESVAFELPIALSEPPELAPPPDTGAGIPAPLALLWSALPHGPLAWLPALLGAAMVGLTACWARRASAAPRWLPVARLVVGAFLAVALAGAGSRALVDAANAVPDASAQEENPIAMDADSLDRGERLYLANCASCHGADGAGDGPVVTLPAAGPLADAVRGASDGELSYRIAVGIAGTPMPAFAGTISPEERWHLVNHLRDRFGGD